VLGILRDKWGAYTPASPVLAGALSLAIILALTLPRYPRR